MSSYPVRKYTGKRKASTSRSSASARPMYKSSAASAVPTSELKAYDTNSNAGVQALTDNPASFQLTNAGVTRLLNAMGAGSDFNARIGRKVTNASIHVNLHIRRINEATVGQDTYARIMLIWDKQPNGAAALPTIAQLLYTGTAPNLDLMKAHNLDNRQRFVYLYDQTKHLASVGANDAGYNSSIDISINKSLGRTPTQYANAQATSSADNGTMISTGALYLFVCGSIMSATTDPNWNVIATSRLRYYD